jgi:hypothetical protein
MWKSKSFRKLCTEEKLLYLYLLTSPHQTSAGVHELPEAYACADLNWQPEEYRKWSGRLVRAGVIRVDAETDEVLIEDWFEDNPPMNKNHFIGACRLVEKVKSEALRRLAKEALERTWTKTKDEQQQRSERPDLRRTEYMKGASRP